MVSWALMREVDLMEVVRYCDRLLKIGSIRDHDRALNGLQVQNSGRVRRLAASVDCHLRTVQKAIAAGADLLLVHHGLFWLDPVPITGARFELMRLLIESDLAVYSVHLPLDVHPRLGNNALMCRALGLKQIQPFLVEHGVPLGYQGLCRMSFERFVGAVSQLTGTKPRVIPAGPRTVRKVGVVTGAGGSKLAAAAAEGIDTFVTGEAPHWCFALAEDLHLNVVLAGHYATETLGVKALTQHLSQRFRIPWVFVDHPSGL